MKEDVTGIIMAGGKSSRMGFDKGLAIVNGQMMIKHVYEALSKVVSQVIIVANSDSYNFMGLPVYKDLITGKGPLSGIYTALHYSPTAHNLIVACDMPFVSKELLSYILERSKEKEVVVPRYNGFMEPLCGYYNGSIKDRLSQHLDNDELSLNKVIRQLDFIEFDIENHGNFKAEEIQSINSINDFKKDSKMNLTILFFGALTEACGVSELKLNSDLYSDTGSLDIYLQSVYPKLTKQKYKIAVNQELIKDCVELKDGDEVSLLPPFAGG